MLNAFIDAMRINLNHTSYIAILLLILSGCEINQNEIMPEDGFMKIYNHPDEQLALYPESVLELPEGGYIFISAVKDENAEIEYPYAYLDHGLRLACPHLQTNPSEWLSIICSHEPAVQCLCY